MTVPIEFSTGYIEDHSPPEAAHHHEFLSSREPFRSMLANNPWLAPPDIRAPLEWGVDRYWDTTTAAKHPFWREQSLPQPCHDIRQLREDLRVWGYCLIADGMSAAQCEEFYTRLWEQAEAERIAGVHHQTPSGQYVNTLVNKGACFALCIEQHPSAVQAGPVIEQLLNETLGQGWICHSFLANGADPGGYPQGLHIDQGPLLPWMTVEAPALVNTMYIPQDVDEHNGGTLVIPGSHQILMEAGSAGEVGELPPAINLAAPAGTIMIFDGRMLHGTGANRSDKRRFVATMSNVKPWMRTQENWVLSVAPDVLEGASAKLRHRMGFSALTYGSTVEGFGLGARGRAGDVWGDITPFRRAVDEGAYERVREMSPATAHVDKTYTVALANAAVERARQ